MKENTSSKTFVGGAVLLAVAGVMTKFLGAFFRIPLANMIGDEGMGYYQTAYPVYSALLSLSSTGVATAISKLVAERTAGGRYKDAFRVYRRSLVLMIALGLVTSFGLVIFGKSICNAIKEPKALLCLYSLAPALLVCPVLSSIRGYFQGRREMLPTALSQIIEQIFRVGAGIGLALVLMDKGVEYAAAGATGGASVGAVFAFLCVAFIFIRYRKKIKREIRQEKAACGGIISLEPGKSIYKDIFTIAVPITIGGLVMPFINTIDTVIVKSRLISIGYDSVSATSLYGQLSGMAQPISNLPDVITSAVNLSLVPAIAQAFASGNTRLLKKNTELGVRYASLIGIPCAVGMFILAEPIMLLLYPAQQTAAISAAGCLMAYAPSVFFFAYNQVFVATLQGIGKPMVPVFNLGIAAVIKLITTYILVGNPSINIAGAAISTDLTYLIAAILNFIVLKKYTHIKMRFLLCFFRPVLSSAVMGVCAWGTYRLLSAHFGNSLSVVLSVLAAVIVYAIMIFVTRSITTKELRQISALNRLINKAEKVFSRHGKH